MDNNQFSETEVLILCGGRGERLKNLLMDLPKPMIGFNGAPFLDFLLNYLYKENLGKITFCTGFRGEVISNHYSRKTAERKTFNFSRESSPLGTGGAIKNAEKHITGDYFFVLNGDSFCNVNLPELYKFHLKNKGLATIAITETEDSISFGSITTNKKGLILNFQEKKAQTAESFVNAGVYLFRKEILGLIPEGQSFSLEYDLFPRLAGKSLFSFKTESELYDIGTPERYEYAQNSLSKLFTS